MSNVFDEKTEPAPPQSPKPSPTRGSAAISRNAQFRMIALVVILVIGGLILWLALRGNGSNNSAKGLRSVKAATPTQINALASSLGHPIFWLGPISGYTYELSRFSNGNVEIRYLPPGVPVGSKAEYPSVGTYPFTNASAAIDRVARKNGEVAFSIPNDGRAVFAKNRSTNVYAAYPGLDYQTEIFDPTPGAARSLAARKLAALGNPADFTFGPRAMTLPQIQVLSRGLKHPLYWVGPKTGYTYEVRQMSGGRVAIRYLPKGAPIGSSTKYLAIGTYPAQGAFGEITSLSKKSGETSINLPGGGLAVFKSTDPGDIHLAYPGSDVQIEVFDLSPAVARNLVSSGRVTSIG
jgi:hypothetical protein